MKPKETVRARIAREMGTSESYIKRAEQYAKGLDLMDVIVPGIRNEVLLGTRKIPETEITAIAKAAASDRAGFVRALLDGRSVAAEIKKRRSEELEKDREALQRIEEYSAEMEKPKDPISKAESVLFEMNDALDSMIFRWNFVLNNPHTAFTDNDILELKRLFSAGLDYIRELEQKWESEYVGTDH